MQDSSSQQVNDSTKREPLSGGALAAMVAVVMILNVVAANILLPVVQLWNEVAVEKSTSEGDEVELDYDEMFGDEGFEEVEDETTAGDAYVDCTTEIAYRPAFATREYYISEKEAFENSLEERWAQDIASVRAEDRDLADVYEKSINGFKAALETQADYRDYVAVKQTKGNYLCVEEFGIKIKLPESVKSVKYRVDTIRPSSPGELEIVGIEGDEFGDFALGNYGVIDMKYSSTRYDLGKIEWAPMSWLGQKNGCTMGKSDYCFNEEKMLNAMMYSDGDFGVFADTQLPSNILKLMPEVDREDKEKLTLALRATKRLLETKKNYSELGV